MGVVLKIGVVRTDGDTRSCAADRSSLMSLVLTSPNPNRVRDLERALEEVRASRPAATRVLTITDNANSDAGSVAEAIDADPMMTAQVLRLANSAAFGMSERVSSTRVAVSLVGFSAIRSIAVLLASGLRNHKTPVPASFWRHASTTASACAVLAGRFGVVRGDAFSLGLLHDVGLAILHTVDPATHATLTADNDDNSALCAQEMVEFGMSHADAAARVLSEWHFPSAFVGAVACHHDIGFGENPLDRVLLAGDTVAHLVARPEEFWSPEEIAVLESLGVPRESLAEIARNTQEYADTAVSGLI